MRIRLSEFTYDGQPGDTAIKFALRKGMGKQKLPKSLLS